MLPHRNKHTLVCCLIQTLIPLCSSSKPNFFQSRIAMIIIYCILKVHAKNHKNSELHDIQNYKSDLIAQKHWA